MTTLEQVERLRAMANLSYEEAKAVLDAVNGNLLDAVIYLEKQGKIDPPKAGGYYSSQNASEADPLKAEHNKEQKNYAGEQDSSFFSLLKRLAWTVLS